MKLTRDTLFSLTGLLYLWCKGTVGEIYLRWIDRNGLAICRQLLVSKMHHVNICIWLTMPASVSANLTFILLLQSEVIGCER